MKTTAKKTTPKATKTSAVAAPKTKEAPVTRVSVALAKAATEKKATAPTPPAKPVVAAKGTVRINAKTFREALTIATHYLPGVARSLPILQCVRLVIEGAKIQIKGFSISEEVATTFTATSGEMNITTAVDAKRLGKAVARTADEGVVTLGYDAKAKKLLLGSHGELSLITLDVKEFPNDRTGGKEIVGGLIKSAHLFSRALGAFASTDATRFILNGVAVQQNHSVATDGRRLAYVKSENCEAKMEIKLAEGAEVIFPIGLVSLIEKIEGDLKVSIRAKSEDGKIETSPRYITLHKAVKPSPEIIEVAVVSNLVDGNFPNWKQVVPNDADMSHYELEAKKILPLLLASEVIDDEHVTLEVVKDRLVLSSLNVNAGKAERLEVPLTKINLKTGTGSRVYLNRQFLSEAVQAAGPEVRIGIRDENSPVTVDSVKTDWFRSVVMPIRKV